jgi:hypothetical protein
MAYIRTPKEKAEDITLDLDEKEKKKDEDTRDNRKNKVKPMVREN